MNKNSKIKLLVSILACLQAPGVLYAAPNSASVMAPNSKVANNKSAAPSNAASATSKNTNTATSPAAAPESAADQPLDADKVVLNFENADIQAVIKAISQLSGKNFVIDPRVKGTINIVSDHPISKVDSYKVLESALRMQGFASVEADGVIKVLPETDAKTYGMHTNVNNNRQGRALGDQIVTRIFVIEHGSATALSNALRPLIAPNNSISTYPNSNALIITDYSSNLNRIAKIITKLTSTEGGGITTKPMIVTLHNAIAADVAQILQNYISGSSGGKGGGSDNSPQATVTIDAPTNSLIIYSSVQDTLSELIGLANNIDKNFANVNNDMHVVYLKNADANHVADVLRAVMNGQEDPDISASSSLAHFATEPTSTFNVGGGSGGGGGGGMSAASARPSKSKSSSGNSNAGKDAPKIVIQSDPTTNSLIIIAPQAVYKNMRMIIDMLDIRRAQVMIEAMIAEINQTEQGAFGIQWLVGGGTNAMGAIAAGNYAGGGNSLSSLATTAIGATGGAGAAGASGGLTLPNQVYVGLVTGTTTVGGQTIPSLSVLGDMISANSAGNVLSRPTLITMDNEEARIMVGQNIGIPNGSFTASAGSPGNLTTTITRQDLGVILQIKPLITQNGSIQLDVYQEDSKVDPNQVANSPNGPSFLERKLRTTLLVDDGQIIALGGMTEDTIKVDQTGVPGLSNIPYLGWLFSWQERVHTKTNLVLFLRPVIIKNAEGYKALTNQRYSYIMNQQNMVQAKGSAMLPDIKAVNMDNQLPYDNQVMPQNPSLNLNQDLPVVDLTNNGTNVHKSNPNAAIKSSAVITKMPLNSGNLNSPSE